MKLLHVTPSISRSYGGPTSSLVAYSRAAIAAGATITIAASTPRSPDEWLSNELPEAELRVFKNYGRGAMFVVPALHDWLRHHGAAFDVVHVHGLLNPVSSLAARACVANGWPLVIRPFGTMSRYTFTHRRGVLKRLYGALLDRPNLESAGALHFTTDEERSESAWQGVSWGDRAFVIPPPWLADGTGDLRERRTERRSVLLLSRLHPVKSVELLLQAWPMVLQYLPNSQLLIAGDGDSAYVRELRAKADQYQTSITFVGFVQDDAKRDLFARADLFVLPSMHENFGIAVFEAIAAGLPVVITSGVQLSRFVRDHSLGVISERSPEALANSIVGALRDNVLSDRCRSRGALLLRQHFPLNTVGEQLFGMYRFAIANPHA